MPQLLALCAVLGASLLVPYDVAQSATPTLTTLHSFTGQNGDGASPNAGVLLGGNGALYGTTYYGGLAGCADNLGCGTVYKLTPPATPGEPWTETILYRFTGGSDGANPEGGLAIGTNGALYGTTVCGGIGSSPACGTVPGGSGTVFKLTRPTAVGAAWTETVLHSFAGGNDGAVPRGGVPVIGARGTVYGTTQNGGGTGCSGYGCGTVYKLTPPATPAGTWTETVLHRFTGGSDGASPDSSLAISAHGALYGTTSLGGDGSCPLLGSEGCGTVFRLAPSESLLYSFPGGSAGAYPLAGVAIGKKGVLYGANAFGGRNNESCPSTGCGTVYELTAPATPGGVWIGICLHQFTGSDGNTPFGTLVVGSDGALYGTTYYGGASNYGTVFRLAR